MSALRSVLGRRTASEDLRKLHGEDRFMVNVGICFAQGQLFYRCYACEGDTPLTVWNRGYKPEYLAGILLRELANDPIKYMFIDDEKWRACKFAVRSIRD